MIELKTYAGSNVTPQNDAILNDTNTLNNGIYYGCNVTIKDATTLHINAGQGIVYGRLFEVLDSDIPVSLSPSGTLLGQLYVHIDLSNIAAPIQILVDTGETLADLEDDPQLNIDSGITDMQLATFTVSTVGMSDLVETFKAVEPIRAVLGDADISAIGDGTVKGSIRALNTHLSVHIDTPHSQSKHTYYGHHHIVDVYNMFLSSGQDIRGLFGITNTLPTTEFWVQVERAGNTPIMASISTTGTIRFMDLALANTIENASIYGHFEFISAS